MTEGGRALPFLRRHGWALGLIALHVWLATSAVREKSPTYDETAHLGRAHAYWRTGDFRLSPPHPPLVHLWVGLPPFAPAARLPLDSEEWMRSSVFEYGRRFAHSSGNDVMALLQRGRFMISLVSAALGGLIYLWSLQLFGRRGALISLLLFAFSPLMLAHGALVTTDTALAFVFLLATFATWRATARLTPLSVTLACLAMGMAYTTKMAAHVMVLVAIGIVVVRVASSAPLVLAARGRSRSVISRPKRAAILGTLVAAQLLAAWAAIWLAYGLRYETFRGEGLTLRGQSVEDGRAGSWESLYAGVESWRPYIEPAREHRLLPEAYLAGILEGSRAARRNPSFLDGRHSSTGFRSFFPMAFLYKTPLPFLGVLLLALAAGLGLGLASRRSLPAALDAARAGLARTAPLWLLAIFVFGAMIPLKMNIGHRHILAVYPPLFVLAGAAAVWWDAGRWLRRGLVALVVLAVASSMAVRPHYLASFNLIAGGPSNGWRHLVDSSIDWGQDLIGLRKWLAEHARPDEATFLAYFGNSPPRHFGVLAMPLPHSVAMPAGDSRPAPGIHAISVTHLQQVYLLNRSEWTPELERDYRALQRVIEPLEAEPLQGWASRGALAASRGPTVARQFDRFQRLRFAKLCAYLREQEPDDHVGHSILIWRLDEAELAAALK